MTPEEAYEEALRRIRKAEETGALELDLSGQKEGKTGEWEYTGLETFESTSARVDASYLAPIARPLLVRGSQRRPVSAVKPHLAPIAQPLQVQATERRLSRWLASPRSNRSTSLCAGSSAAT